MKPPTERQAARRALIAEALDANFAVLPLKTRGKAPAIAGGVKAASRNPKTIDHHFESHPSQNYGIATGRPSGIFLVDVDGAIGRKSLQVLQGQHGKLPDTVTVRTGRGVHLYFRHAGARIRNSAGKLGKGIDVKGDGGYVVGAGSVHPSGARYRYVKGKAVGEIAIATAPQWLLDLVTPSRPVVTSTVEVGRLDPKEARRLKAYIMSVFDRELERLRRAPISKRNHTLNLCAFQLGQFVPFGIIGVAEMTAALAKVATEIGLDANEIFPTIQSGLTAGEKAPRALPFPQRSTADAAEEARQPPDPRDHDLAAKLAALGETDADNALRLVTRFGGQMLHAPGRGWLVYDGVRWVPDQLKRREGPALETAQKIRDELPFIADAASSAHRAKFAEQSKSKSAIDRMLALSEAMVAVEDKYLDADLWLLNVENGTLDLKTGELLPHDPRDLITKIAPVRFDREAKCPLWKRVLKRAVGGDLKSLEYLRRLFGYTLTGDVSEQIFAYVYGKQFSSKSTIINSFRDMMGDYGLHTATETLLVKHYDNAIPNDLARLKGARMVTAIEANFGRQIDEAKIKGMTGGDKMTARFMRGEWFEFVPEFKLWIVANDYLQVRQSSEAFWRRVRVLSLDVVIPEEERDLDMPGKLRAEWPGILAWAVRGCLAWQAHGLGNPPVVRQATAKWRKAADHVRLFVNDVCVLDPQSKTPSSLLYLAYKNWCQSHGERAMSINQFKVAMANLNINDKRTKTGSIWEGIKVKV